MARALDLQVFFSAKKARSDIELLPTLRIRSRRNGKGFEMFSESVSDVRFRSKDPKGKEISLEVPVQSYLY